MKIGRLSAIQKTRSVFDMTSNYTMKFNSKLENLKRKAMKAFR